MADSMIDTAGMDISKFMVGESIKYAAVSYTHLDVYKRQVMRLEALPVS